MENEELITKISQVFERSNGSEVKITAAAFTGSGLHQSIDVYVHVRPNRDAEWKLCSNARHPNWVDMSVADYVSHGRSEMLQAASPAEILKVASCIGKPLSSLAHQGPERTPRSSGMRM